MTLTPPFQKSRSFPQISIQILRKFLFPERLLFHYLRRFPYTCYFDGKRILKRFPLSSCQYVSTIPEKKTACYRPSKNRHFVRVCTEKMKDHQYRENGARCSPNQSKKNYTLSTFPSSSRRNFEDSGTVLAVSASQFYYTLLQNKRARWFKAPPPPPPVHLRTDNVT